MSRKQIMLRESDSGVYRRQPLLSSSNYSTRRLTVSEFAGGAAAECAAVACCCPCGLVNFLVLVVYKVPAGLCRKALRRKRQQRLLKKGLLSPRSKGTSTCTCTCSCDESLFHVHPITSPLAVVDACEFESDFDNKEVIELEKEMWDKFYGAGFWRSPSQRSAI